MMLWPDQEYGTTKLAIVQSATVLPSQGTNDLLSKCTYQPDIVKTTVVNSGTYIWLISTVTT